MPSYAGHCKGVWFTEISVWIFEANVGSARKSESKKSVLSHGSSPATSGSRTAYYFYAERLSHDTTMIENMLRRGSNIQRENDRPVRAPIYILKANLSDLSPPHPLSVCHHWRSTIYIHNNIVFVFNGFKMRFF